MKEDCGLHLVQHIPRTIAELSLSRSFFRITALDDSFLSIQVTAWPEHQAYKSACEFVKNLICVNDVAERGIALIHNFNATITKDEEQKQYLLQVVEKHRRDFSQCDRDNLVDM